MGATVSPPTLCGGCGAVFDWNTLRLHTGGNEQIHNPHWYEYQRRLNGGNAPRNIGDVQCGGIPDVHRLERKATSLYFKDKEPVPNTSLSKLYAVHRGYNHNQYTILPLYNVNMVADNRGLRVEFLLKRITEAKFKQQLQMREKAREKKNHIGQILRMYQTAVVDVLMRLTVCENKEAFAATLKEIDGLVEYTNESLAKAAEIYVCVKPYIDAKYIFTTKKLTDKSAV